ncbi:MAG: hypothetical protein DWQ31_15470 [Planctomycetota bacterium]|nr:MAG: hypothetical protein DWQ31_15470 [Planctomycetota bacterium]REJ88872.1 MAG: hypothetical protein DWQ35_19235 [Planctomycetota bacterium]REK25670.1 MAG: hypothetical protein DWQ42_10455 [Planctomycetota bacterium]REK46584.1 MAG: hypothetical protein DWQ46_06850 [Planctomycetota bacterium]
MRQVYLLPNRRVLSIVLVLLVLVLALSVVQLLRQSTWGMAFGLWLTLAAAVAVAAGLAIRSLCLPRVAEQAGELLLYLKSGAPYRVPLEVVECFFLGSTESHLPLAESAPAKVTAVVVRLAEAEESWHTRRVNARLGEWKDGYIRIHGAWCEPLCLQKLGELNARLTQAKQMLRDQAP